MSDVNSGDSIDASLGDNAENANIGKQNTQIASTGNTVHNNFYQPSPPEPYRVLRVSESEEEYQRRMIIELERKTQEKFTEIAIALNKLESTVSTNNRVGEATNELLQRQITEVKNSNETTRQFVVESLRGLRIVAAPAQTQELPEMPAVKIVFPKWLTWSLTIAVVFLFAMGIWFMFYITMGGK